MKCEHCGKENIKTGFQDKYGKDLCVGDLVWIEWGGGPKCGKQLGGLAWIRSVPDFPEDALSGVNVYKVDNRPTHPAIQLESGETREDGEKVDSIGQGIYRGLRDMRDAKSCILLCHPERKE